MPTIHYHVILTKENIESLQYFSFHFISDMFSHLSEQVNLISLFSEIMYFSISKVFDRNKKIENF